MNPAVVQRPRREIHDAAPSHTDRGGGELERVDGDTPPIDGSVDVELRNVFGADQRLTRFETNVSFMLGPNDWCGVDFIYVDGDDLYDEGWSDCQPWGTEFYEWSLAGQLLTVDADWGDDGVINETRAWTYDGQDQLIHFESVSDNPLMAASTQTFTWVEGLQTESTMDLESDGQIEVFDTYAYDAEARLVEHASTWPLMPANDDVLTTAWTCPDAPPPAQKRPSPAVARSPILEAAARASAL